MECLLSHVDMQVVYLYSVVLLHVLGLQGGSISLIGYTM